MPALTPLYSEIGNNIAQYCREIGMERGLNLALELVYSRWSHRRTPSVWINAALDERTSRHSGSIDFEAKLRDLPVVEADLPFVDPICRQIHGLTKDVTSEQELQQQLHQLFEWLLEAKLSRLSRAGQQHNTVQSLSRLLAALIAPANSVFDPACGMGSVLLESGRQGAMKLYGMDNEPSAAHIADIRLKLAGYDAEIRVGDALDPQGWAPEAEAVVIDPPYGLRPVDLPHKSRPTDWKGIGGTIDPLWVMKAAGHLQPRERGFVVLPMGSTFGRTGEFLRNALLDSGCLEAIVRIPSGTLAMTAIPVCVWVVRSPKEARSVDEILMMDVGPLATALGRSRVTLAEPAIALATDILSEWRGNSATGADPTVARSVSYAEVHRQEVLDPRRYLERRPDESAERPAPPVHLLSELRIANLKAFGKAATLPLKPLTLIYGRNSAGKSSVLQSIQLLRQSLDEYHLRTQGKYTDAGSFRTCVHNHEQNRTLRLGFSFGNNPSTAVADGDPSPALLRELNFDFSLGDEHVADIVDVSGAIGGNPYHYRIRPSSADEGAGQAEITLTMSEVRELMALLATPGIALSDARGKSVHSNSGSVERFLRRINEDRVTLAADGLLPGKALITELERGGVSERDVSVAESYLRRGAALVAGAGRELRQLLSNMSYLGPLREAPQRVHLRARSSDDSQDIAAALFNNSSEQAQISRWMQRLGIPYSLEVLRLGTGEGSEILGDPLAISLKDSRSGVAFSPADVGFGVSQVLPILVDISARQNGLICIEQPEIHLHPALQSELADLLIESADPAGRANQIIAETHSEHLMLRIQRRIREGVLDPDLVSILYVDQDDFGEAHVQPLRLDKEGDFLDSWPNGFFEERLDEVFAGL